jgi:cytochrome c oxidase subunit 1
MHLLGAAGHPRRYSELTGVQYVAALAPLQKFITIAAIITISGQLLFLANFFWSMFRGAAVASNPWECTTLEWTLPSPPAHHGFGDREPVVNHAPYEYSVPGAEADFLMQDGAD